MSIEDFHGIGALALIERINSLSPIQRQAVDAALGGSGKASRSRSPVSIGIITALEIEALAMERALTLPVSGVEVNKLRYASAPHAPVTMQVFDFTRDGLSFRVVLAQALKMGNNSAAIAATSLIYEFPEVNDVIMVGIAGGIPSPLVKDDLDQKLIEDHVRLGDIFVAEQPIFQYDFLKAELGKSVNRDMPNAISARIRRTLQRLRRSSLEKSWPWEFHLNKLVQNLGREWVRPPGRTDAPRRYDLGLAGDVVDLGAIQHPVRQPGRRPGKPLVHYGKIGSANTLLKDPRLRDDLRRTFGVRAVEMEGSGIADAAWNFGVGYAVVRGICDYCDPQKSDAWQKYAAAVAAAFSRSIVDDAVEEHFLLVKQLDSTVSRQ